MSHTYNRVFSHIDKSRKDVLNRQSIHKRKCILSTINFQIEIAAMFLNEAITRIEKK